MIRPLLAEDVDACLGVQHAAFYDLDTRQGRPPLELTDEVRTRGRARIAHLQRTDPGSAWAAEVDGELVGCALALVREGMWFLSLLVVKPGLQGKGIGRQLLDAALTTATDRSWIMSTDDPAAVRRYQRAGFVLHPAYAATGVPDRSGLRAVRGVRDFDGDHEALDHVMRAVRGAAMCTELEYFLGLGNRVLVAPGKGFSVLRGGTTIWLAATDEGTARDLLTASLAEAEGKVDVDWLTAGQQWAIDVCLDARMALRAGGSLALRGQPLMSPYLPCGAFG